MVESPERLTQAPPVLAIGTIEDSEDVVRLGDQLPGSGDRRGLRRGTALGEFFGRPLSSLPSANQYARSGIGLRTIAAGNG